MKITLKSTHDYLKLYNLMIEKWGSFLLVKEPLMPTEGWHPNIPMVPYYIQKKLFFDNSSIYSHSFTVSPRSSPLIQNKPLKTQYTLMKNALKDILGKYTSNYYITFEMYEDNLDIHCHGFLTVSSVSHIALIKKEIRSFYQFPKLQRGEYNSTVHTKPIGFDVDQQKRWVGYLYKDLEFMIKNDYLPMYRFTGGKITTTEISKPKPKQKTFIDEDELELYEQQLQKVAYEKELAEFKLYEKLKAKFEKKPLENLFSK